MSSTDKQGSSLDSFPTSPPLYPHFNWPSGFWPCVKSCLVGGSDKYPQPFGSPPGKRFLILRSQGAFPPGFYLPREGWVYRPAPEAPQKGECRRGRGHFWKLPDACGLRPCTRTNHKKALCHTCPFGGAGNKYRFSAFWLGRLAFLRLSNLRVGELLFQIRLYA